VKTFLTSKIKWILSVSFLAGGSFTGTMAFFIQGTNFGYDQITLSAIVPPILVGSLSALAVTYFIFKNRFLLVTQLQSAKLEAAELEATVKARSFELSEQEKRFLDTIENLSASIILYDNNDQIVMCNSKAKVEIPQISNLLVPGTSAETIVRALEKNVLPPDENRDHETWVKQTMDNHRNVENTDEQLMIGGRWIQISRIRTHDGGTLVMRTDITEQKEVETAHRKSEERFRDFALSAVDRFWETDENHKYTYLSPPTSRFKGSPENFIGKTLWESLIGRTEPEILKNLKNVTEKCETFHGVHASWLGMDGEMRYAQFNGIAIFDDDENFKGYRGTTIDETELKSSEVEFIRARVEAETANKTKSEFLANMSHELRTPLNAIIGFSETLDQEIFGTLLNEKQREYVKDIHISGKHLLDLINEILDISTIEAGKLVLDETEVQIEPVIDAALRLTKPRAEQGGVELQFDLNGLCPAIRGDERRLKQIFVNLLSNAIKFTDEGGIVSVGIERGEDGSLAISVNDNGIGMNDDDILRALEKFGQGRSEKGTENEGTGLGLPLSKGLVEAHNGKMRIESSLGQGTTVSVLFPDERVSYQN